MTLCVYMLCRRLVSHVAVFNNGLFSCAPTAACRRGAMHSSSGHGHALSALRLQVGVPLPVLQCGPAATYYLHSAEAPLQGHHNSRVGSSRTMLCASDMAQHAAYRARYIRGTCGPGLRIEGRRDSGPRHARFRTSTHSMLCVLCVLCRSAYNTGGG
eukprot:jgi/Ulvmu1/1567/UM110_0030.1